MATFNNQRLEKKFEIAISDIINNELQNANLGITTVTKVELSRDKNHLKVFVSFVNHASRSLEALKSATGFIKKSLSRLEGFRKVPDLTFLPDKSFDEGRKIDALLEQIKDESSE